MLSRLPTTFKRDHKKQVSYRKSFIADRLNSSTIIDAILPQAHLVSQSPLKSSSSKPPSSSSTFAQSHTKITVPNSQYNRLIIYNQGQQGSDKMLNNIYYLSALLLTLCAILLSQSQLVSADALLQSQLQKLKISPDIISVPSYVETIKIEVHGNVVKPGDPVPAKHFKDLNMDKITWDVSNFDARHTLVLLDLDRKPTLTSANNSNSIYNQFTSLNIPGNVIKAGQNIAAFDTPIVPCPPSLKHRLLMLAFHQKQNIDISEVAYISTASGPNPKRENFKINEFMNKHRLELVAANVILAAGDPSGVCSGSSANHSNISSILFAMVMVATAFGIRNRFLAVN